MLREEMIYHEKTQIRAKAGFHVSIEMYDGMKYMMYVKYIYWHSLDIGSDTSAELWL